MGTITVRNLPEETHQALRIRAAQNGRSTEAEVRAILESAVRPQDRMKVGSVLAAFGDRYKLDDLKTSRLFDFTGESNTPLDPSRPERDSRDGTNIK
ncbi:MAG: hypothetical protein U0103_16875 [Candidatus Obscuribacterales bacterium]